jgi:hypothetical protein
MLLVVHGFSLSSRFVYHTMPLAAACCGSRPMAAGGSAAGGWPCLRRVRVGVFVFMVFLSDEIPAGIWPERLQWLCQNITKSPHTLQVIDLYKQITQNARHTGRPRPKKTGILIFKANKLEK